MKLSIGFSLYSYMLRMADQHSTVHVDETFSIANELFTAEDDGISAEVSSIVTIYTTVGRTTMSVLLVCGTFGNVMTIVVMRTN